MTELPPPTAHRPPPTLQHCPESMRPHVDKVLAGEYDLPARLELIEPPRTVLDIGANVGAFTAWARAKWPDCFVNAFEPMRENQIMLESNFGADNKVLTFWCGVSATGEPMRLFRGRNNCGENSVYDLGEQTEEVETVLSAKAAKLKKAEFVKIDTEGCEVEILQGLDLSETRVVAYEWHGIERRDQCFDILKNLPANHLGKFVIARFCYSSHDRGVHIWARTEAVREVSPPSTTPLLHHSPASAPPPAVVLSLAIPVYGGVDPHFYSSMLDLAARRGSRDYALCIPPALVGESLVSRARNRLACDFLRSDSTHLLFIDSDLIFSPEHVDRIAAHAARGVPIVAGLYPKKQIELGWVCNLLEPSPPADEHDLVPVKYAGTGFLCIAREVFEKMMLNYPGSRYDPDDGDAWQGDLWDFFPVGVWECPETGRRRYLSEDWWFCQRARDLGYPVMMDQRIVLKHVGQFIYPFDKIEEFAESLP